MNDQTAVPDLRQFLLEHVATYDELEALLLLQRRPELAWEVNAAAQALGLAMCGRLSRLDDCLGLSLC